MKKQSPIYKQRVVLKTELKDVECWNFTGGEVFTIPVGTPIEVDCVHDTTHTTIGVMDLHGECCGMPCTYKDGTVHQGYRFIVENQALAEATGLPIPKTTRDLVGEMIAFESGEMDEEQARSLLTTLRDEGTLNGLQGFYGRAAHNLGII